MAGFFQSRLIRSLAIVALAGSVSFASLGQQSSTPASTPAGIMLVEVHREEGFSSDQFFWTRLGDSDGSTLFYSADGSDSQSDEFHPVLAAEGAVAFGDWSLVTLAKASQWAYQGQPLFSWSQEAESGQIAINVALYGEGPNGEEPVSANTRDALLPPEGWQVARFTPAATAIVPDGFDLRLVDSGQGVAITNFEGFSLYSFDSRGNAEGACAEADCYEKWQPVAAPALAIGLGEFSVVDRNDGSRQWAFRGDPLFRYKGDLLPGDANGRLLQDPMRLTLLSQNFQPEGVSISPQAGYGDILALNGKTLYFGSAFEKYWGGRNLRGSFEIAYFKGKRLGGDACVSAECLESWRPFTAPADAAANGFWEVFTRADGSLQWAYKGFALYTFDGDEDEGHMRGHSLYDIADVDGDEAAIARTKQLAEVGNALGGAGVYWSVAKP